MPPVSLLLLKNLEKDHYGCTVMAKSVLRSSPFPTPLWHWAVDFLASWDWKVARNPGCLPLSAAVTLPYVFLQHCFRHCKMQTQTQRYLLPYKNCFSWSLWFCTLFHKAPALYNSILRKCWIQRALALCFQWGIKPTFYLVDEKGDNPLCPLLGLYQTIQE